MMITGSIQSDFTPSEVSDRLKVAMAAGNFEILSQSNERIDFRHGTYLTQSATLLPKHGSILITQNGSGSRVDYEIEISGFAKYWLAFFGIILCWLIIPAILVHRALFHHPDRLMKNLLQAI
ncbi:MAG: hypothetical protein ACSHX4_11680 [Opitutaceae bacterium]